MFGYVTALKPELKIKEFEAYRAAYCGLCRELGHHFGPLARLPLSYDMVFLALVGLGLSQEPPCAKQGRCLLNPFAKRCFFIESDSLRYAAYAGSLLTWGKLRDDAEDERFGRRLLTRMAMPFYWFTYRKAKKTLPEADRVIREELTALRETERGENPRLDECAHRFSQITAYLFENLPGGGSQRRVLRELGYFLGRWIYLMDACDDFEKDRERGRFNPLTGDEDRERLLNDSLNRIFAAFELLTLAQARTICENIVYLGMPARQRLLLESKTGEQQHERSL